MKVSYEWLQSFFDEKLPAPAELSELIEKYAFEVEEVIGEGEGAVLDINITPNRAHDALSHRGIATEVSALLKQPLANDPLRGDIPLEPQAEGLSVSLESPLCRRYVSAVIDGVDVKPSPEWLKRRLEAIGQRSINNVVDATNYVMFHTGQPLHAFDASRLEERDGTYAIAVRLAKEGEVFIALDGKTYTLSPADLVIGDGHSGSALGIAGVKGGKAAEVNASTKKIIIESANFDPLSVRKTAKRIKLRTDASVRFENELSPELSGYGALSVVELIFSIAGGELVGYRDIYPNPTKNEPVSVSLSRVNKVLGTHITKEETADILTRLRLSYTEEGDVFTVTAPFERLDIKIPEDLIEEIGRMYGYDRVEAVIPEKVALSEVNKRFYYTEKIRQILIEEGFSEIYTSSFRAKDTVELANALASDKGFLRSSLSGNMADALALNAHNAPLLGLSEARLFEMGTVFKEKEEHFSLILGVSGKGAQKTLTSVLEKLSEGLKVSTLEKVTGEICEINLDILLEKLPAPETYEPTKGIHAVSYKPFSAYPFVLRDVALWVPENTPASDIEALIREKAGNLLVRLDLFDTFTKEGRVSYAFHLVFQASDRTLTDDEVNPIMESVYVALQGKGFEIR